MRDHHELVNMGYRIEKGNAAINRELAQQGATIAQVLQGIHVRTRPPRSTYPPVRQVLTLHVAVAFVPRVCVCVCVFA